ncbi:MAG: hypothetical protein J07HX64_00114 [halophilic archaeon J07HX64]|nr:MAG: hypothetical protein J07HX64_00114 [halophilic archaeon J07HX64]
MRSVTVPDTVPSAGFSTTGGVGVADIVSFALGVVAITISPVVSNSSVASWATASASELNRIHPTDDPDDRSTQSDVVRPAVLVRAVDPNRF